MTIPHTIELESGGAICASVVNGKVLLVVSPNATLTRAECEHVGDLLWACGVEAEPPEQGPYQSKRPPAPPAPPDPPPKRVIIERAPHSRAKPITSVDDERVKP